MPIRPPLTDCPSPRSPWGRRASVSSAVLALAVLSACGGGGGGGVAFMPLPPAPAPAPAPAPVRGSLVEAPAKTLALTAQQLTAALGQTSSGAAILQVAGTPRCGVEVQSLHYNTVGGKNEDTTATGALMLPTGTDPACTGQRPIVLYAHGTNPDRSYDLSQWATPGQAAAGEGAIIAAVFAAQGFTVVAPNYAGYDKSTLSYHPYLNGTQQGRDMADALTAARSVLPLAGVSDGGQLFISGYSQGGYVALAAHRELQAQGVPVTASAPLSAPSAISLLIDYSFMGWPALGSSIFVPMLSTSWQQQFGDVYNSPADIYESRYATGIENLLPSVTPVSDLFATGKLPLTALFPANAVPGPLTPELSIFYGANPLVRQSYLTNVANDILGKPCSGNALPATQASLVNAAPLDCQPDTGFRRAAVANDLRNWLPKSPVLFCGGDQDPTVNFISTRATAGYFAASGMPSELLHVLNLEEAGGSGDPYAAARAGLAQAKTALADATSGDAAVKAAAVLQAYHGSLVPPFCAASARGFFAGVMGSNS